MPFVSEPYIAALDLDAVDKLVSGHLPLGEHPETGDVLLVPEDERHAGIYLSGVQGAGKSAMLANLILQDAKAGKAVILIDPHADLARSCIERLPTYAVVKTHLLDMEDEAYPFGVNPFGNYDTSTGLKLARAVDQCMHIFETVWPEVLKQHYFPKFLRAAIIVLLANPGMTLVDMRHFLLDDRFRAQLLKHVTDPMVLDFWRSEYDELSGSERSKRVGPLLGRLDLLFVGRSIVRNIVGQSETSINFRMAIENKELIFITLPTQSLTQDARLIGTMLMAQIPAAVFSFGDLPPDKRPGVSIYIDEFQNFVTQDIAELFTQGRKFGVKLTVAHQYRGQLPDYLRQATMTARTKICFQQTPDDAHEMAHLFRSKHAEVRPEDIDPHPIKWLLTYPINDYNIRLFVDRYLRVLQSMRRGGMVKFTARTSLATALQKPLQTIEVWDPTLHLDQFFYEVMTTGDPSIDIPWEIVEGLSGCGYTFYHEWQRTLNKEWWLGPAITFPAALVVERPDGSQYWTRRPEGPREELYSCLFLLRQTMLYLAEHPLGEATTLSTSEVAQMLTELPHRAAFVRTGDDVGVIYTIDAPPAVPANELQERLAIIQSQTREKYCTPKAEVEQRLGTSVNSKSASTDIVAEEADTTDTPPIPRWEEF